MSGEPQPQDPRSESDFANQAEQGSPSLLVEFFSFLKHNKKWWLLPIVVVLILLGLLIVLSGTAVAPFIYTLF